MSDKPICVDLTHGMTERRDGFNLKGKSFCRECRLLVPERVARERFVIQRTADAIRSLQVIERRFAEPCSFPPAAAQAPTMRVDNEAQAVVLHKALKAYSSFVTGQDEPRLSCLIASAADLVSDFEDRRDP